MTGDELKRLDYYSEVLDGCQGDIAVLKIEERNELSNMLLKWLIENKIPVNG